MSSRFTALLPLAAILLLGARCGGDADGGKQEPSQAAKRTEQTAPAVDACTLLTGEEIEAVTGVGGVAPRKEAHGAVGTCNYHAGEQLMPVVSLLLAPGMPKMSSSAEMADWRSKQGTSFGGVKLIIEPIEGLGVPAIRNEVEGAGMVTVETAVRGMMLDVTTSSLEHSKTLAAKAMARVP
jgi:hypothetical protein